MQKAIGGQGFHDGLHGLIHQNVLQSHEEFMAEPILAQQHEVPAPIHLPLNIPCTVLLSTSYNLSGRVKSHCVNNGFDSVFTLISQRPLFLGFSKAKGHPRSSSDALLQSEQ